MPSVKVEIRQRLWMLMECEKVARSPLPLHDRIPNFVGAERAAQRLAELEIWKRANAIKANPDSPQRPVRERALREGKTVYMAVPRLREEKCFIELNPLRLRGRYREASSIKGAFAMGRPVSLDEMPRIDLVVAGSVAVTRHGARVGKGGGFSDLEFALGRQVGIITDETPVATTVHPLQIVTDGVPMLMHDIPVDFIVTPEEVIETRHSYPKPKGIYWELLPEEKLENIPVLQELRRWSEGVNSPPRHNGE